MPSTRRALIVRPNQTALRWVEDRAEQHATKLSVVTRAMLSVATSHPTEVDAKIKQMTEA